MTNFKDKLHKLRMALSPEALAALNEKLKRKSAVPGGESSPDAPKKSLLADIMAKLKSADAKVERQEPVLSDAQVGPGKLAGLLKRKAQATDAEQKETAPKEALRHAAKGNLRFVVQPDGARETVWSLGADNSVTRLGDPEPGELLLSFSNQDFRFTTKKSVSHTKALNQALEGMGQAVRIAGRTADLRTFYARPVENMPDYDVIPGLQLIDQALALDKVKASFPLIAGFELGLPDQSQVVVLCHYDDAGDVGRTQVSMNPESIEFVLAQFASTRRLDLAAIPVKIYDADMLRRCVPHMEPFADEDPIMGLPPTQFYRRANRVALIGAIGGLAFFSYYYTMVESAESAAAGATEAAQGVIKQKGDLLASSPTMLGAQFALQGLKALRAAEELYRPGIELSLDSQADGVTITANAVMNMDMPAEERIQLLDDMRKLPTPANCKRGEFNLASTLNEAKIVYNCYSNAGNFSQYRPK